MTRLHHRWGVPEAEIFVLKFLPWPRFEPRTSQSNGRERCQSNTAQLQADLRNTRLSEYRAVTYLYIYLNNDESKCHYFVKKLFIIYLHSDDKCILSNKTRFAKLPG